MYNKDRQKQRKEKHTNRFAKSKRKINVMIIERTT
jgi:hypothetical protein